VEIGKRTNLQYSNPVCRFQSDLPGIRMFVADFLSKASATTPSVLLQRKCWQLKVRRGILPTDASVELSGFRQDFKFNSCLSTGRASKQRFFGRMATLLGCRLAGFSRPLQASGGRKCFLTTQDSEELPSLTILVLYLIHETKTTGKEKSRIPTILLKQNLVTQLSRFGILPNNWRTGKISPNFRNHSQVTPGDYHLNYAYMPDKINPENYQVRR